ncbi:hypothetical protein WMY93_003319 [Mugilogobius chulae]|uniref:Uncharacterized protein n=1 Tax=Mugilogobius chulae TaxID=88201 RepID=A0AAW0PVT1_9GOBI
MLSGPLEIAQPDVNPARHSTEFKREKHRGHSEDRIVVILVATLMLVYYCEFTDTFRPALQGFTCRDPELSKPYPGPEQGSRVQPVILYSVVGGLPVVLYTQTKFSSPETTMTHMFMLYFLNYKTTKKQRLLKGKMAPSTVERTNPNAMLDAFHKVT